MRKQMGVLRMMVMMASGMVYADQVVLDDQIILGSLSVGQNSVDGESFGFDTFRLKEDNLRIHFQDTSTSSSFPGNDWRIVINDSANGGANFFAIEDSDAARQIFRVEAGAPASSLYVEDHGWVGLGTATPSVALHIADGNTPTVRLDQDGSEGWGTQVWDMAANEVNFFIRDVTNGNKLPFRIRPNCPSDSLMLLGNGNVGIGLSSPEAKLHVNVASNAVAGLVVGPEGTVASNTLHVAGSAFIGGTLTIASSRSLKENISRVSIDEAMAAFSALEPVRYNYIGDTECQLGFIAEDVPDLVAINGRNGLSPMDFSALLTRVVQEQSRREAELAAQVEAQSAVIDSLMQRLERLENQSAGEY